MYQTIEDLPVVCRINLPVDAQQVYRDAFNRAWKLHADKNGDRHRLAQSHAWAEVRARFERDQLSGRWLPRKSQ